MVSLQPTTSVLGVTIPIVNTKFFFFWDVGEYITPTTAPVMSTNTVATTATYFIAAQKIGFYATGLKPGTVLYPYFDKQPISQYCSAANLNYNLNAPTKDDFYQVGALSGTLTTDAKGNVAGIFYLPAGTFYSGDREFILSDQSSITSVPSSATEATVYFKAYNYKNSTSSSIISPRPSPSSTDVTTTRSTIQNSNFDPMCQSFFISSDMTNGAEGVFITSVDLFFKSVSTSQGITIDIRTMENGVPTTTILPFSKKHTAASGVSVSSTGLTPTMITFESPVFLRAGFNYAVSIIPDGQSPDYQIWTTVVGHKDINTNTAVTKNWGEGVLFTSSTGTIWTPIQNQYLKFTLYKAQFNTTNSNLIMTNDNLEFLSLSNISSAFTQGEAVFQSTSNSAGTISVSNTSSAVSGIGTNFTSNLIPGQKIIIQSGNSYSLGTVNTISSNTALTLNEVPSFSNTLATFMLPVVGHCTVWNPNGLALTLNKSTANTTSYFTANLTIIGVISGSSATITAVNDKIVSRFQPLFYTTAVQDTAISYSANVITSAYANTNGISFSLGKTNYISNNEVIIASKTNEILNYNGSKSFSANVVFSTGDLNSSPTLDMQSASLLGYKNIINNNDFGENTRYGYAVSKSVSNLITLAPGLASEDITIFLNAYKPTGTNIEIFGKFLNQNDPDSFSTKDWSQLVQITDPSVVSNPANRNDIKEYQYGLPTFPKYVIINGNISINSGSKILTGYGTTFLSQLSPGSNIILFGDSSFTTYQVLTVATIVSDSQLTTVTPAVFTINSSGGGVIGSVSYPKAAFKNYQNQGIIRYYNSNVTPFDTYTQFAIKVVFLSQYSYLVPRLLDYRILATSV